MNLIEPLACGIRGAAGGHVVVTVRDTGAPARMWADYSGKVRRFGEPVLGSHGEIDIYVDELVLVEVYDRTGDNLVRSFVDGVSSYPTTVDSTVTVGINYLSAVLYLVSLSAGSTDWNVAVTGGSVKLSDAFDGLVGAMYNVKDSRFGAIGDGSAEDSGPLQAAVDRADLNGGGIVYLPKGTYKISTAIEVPAGVSILGAGPASAIVSSAAGLENAFTFVGAGASGTQYFRGIGVTSSVEHAASLIVVKRGVDLTIDECVLGDQDHCRGPLLEAQAANALGTSDRTNIVVTNTAFIAGDIVDNDSNYGRCVSSYLPARTGRIVLRTCRFTSPVFGVTTYPVPLVFGLCTHLRDCYFYVSVSTATVVCIKQSATTGAWGSVSNTYFGDGPFATIQMLMHAVLETSGDWFSETYNRFDGSVVRRYVAAANDTTAAGYYAKATSNQYYQETSLPSIAGARTTDLSDNEAMLLRGSIVANTLANATATVSTPGLTVASLTNPAALGYAPAGNLFVPIGSKLTFLGYAAAGPLHGTGSIDVKTNSSTTGIDHYAIPGLDPSVGTGYFAYGMMLVRTYGTPGPTLRSKWYCYQVGGYTKAGVTRKSY